MNNLQLNGGLFSIPNPLADWTLKLISSDENAECGKE